MRLSSLLPALVPVAFLAGCGHMPVSTMVQLRNFDLAEADPDILRAGVRIPDSLEPRPGGVRLEIEWWRKDAPSKKEIRRIVLEETTAPAEIAPLNGEKRRGFSLHVYRIPQSDIAGLRSAQGEVRAARAQAPGQFAGNLRIAADACRRADMPEGKLLSTTWLLPDRPTGFLPLLVNVDLRSLAKNAAELLEALPPCGKFTRRAD